MTLRNGVRSINRADGSHDSDAGAGAESRSIPVKRYIDVWKPNLFPAIRLFLGTQHFWRNRLAIPEPVPVVNSDAVDPGKQRAILLIGDRDEYSAYSANQEISRFGAMSVRIHLVPVIDLDLKRALRI